MSVEDSCHSTSRKEWFLPSRSLGRGACAWFSPLEVSSRRCRRDVLHSLVGGCVGTDASDQRIEESGRFFGLRPGHEECEHFIRVRVGPAYTRLCIQDQFLFLSLALMVLFLVWVGALLGALRPVQPFLLVSKSVDDVAYSTTLYFPDADLIELDDDGRRRYPDDFGSVTTDSGESIIVNEHKSYKPQGVQVIDLNQFLRHYRQTFTLNQNGFEYINIGTETELQTALKQILEEGLTPALTSRIRDSMTAVYRELSDASYLWVAYVATEGIIVRQNRVGEDGVVKGSEQGARTVHGDQDLFGEPLVSKTLGLAPFLFHPVYSPFRILNVWIPLRKVHVRPLALMNTATLNRSEHELRYHIVNRFLDGSEESYIFNDCWTYAHSEEQRWYWKDGQDSKTAIVFDTLGTPHTSFMVPGELYAAEILRAFENVRADIEKSGVASEHHINATLDLFRQNMRLLEAPPTLQASIKAMQSFFLHTVLHGNTAAFGEGVDRFLNQTTRISIEMRVVAVNLSHTTFVDTVIAMVAMYITWRVCSYFIVHLYLDPDKELYALLGQCFKGLFQMA